MVSDAIGLTDSGRWMAPSTAATFDSSPSPARWAEQPATADASAEGASAGNEAPTAEAPLFTVEFSLTEGAEPDVEVLEDVEVTVLGESFVLTVEEGVAYLSHPRWSLLGSGPTFADAEADLYHEAAELAEVMAEVNPADLDEAALDLREFVLAFFGTSFPETTAA